MRMVASAKINRFQSSPDPKAECNFTLAMGLGVGYIVFQSSPDPKAECNTPFRSS